MGFLSCLSHDVLLCFLFAIFSVEISSAPAAGKGLLVTVSVFTCQTPSPVTHAHHATTRSFVPLRSVVSIMAENSIRFYFISESFGGGGLGVVYICVLV